MKRVDQTEFAPRGNCQAAVLAMLLDLPLEQVPNFFDSGKNPHDWWQAYYQFLDEQGFWFVSFHKEDEVEARAKYTKGYYEVSGPSSRGVEHAVVFKDGELWHDPHPSREGVLKVREVRIYYPREFSRSGMIGWNDGSAIYDL